MTLMLSVLLQVCNMINDANGNKWSDILLGSHYGDDDSLDQNLNAHSNNIPCMTYTDTNSQSKIYT